MTYFLSLYVGLRSIESCPHRRLCQELLSSRAYYVLLIEFISQLVYLHCHFRIDKDPQRKFAKGRYANSYPDSFERAINIRNRDVKSFHVRKIRSVNNKSSCDRKKEEWRELEQKKLRQEADACLSYLAKLWITIRCPRSSSFWIFTESKNSMLTISIYPWLPPWISSMSNDQVSSFLINYLWKVEEVDCSNRNHIHDHLMKARTSFIDDETLNQKIQKS